MHVIDSLMYVTKQKPCYWMAVSRTSGEEKRRMLSVDGSQRDHWLIELPTTRLTLSCSSIFIFLLGPHVFLPGTRSIDLLLVFLICKRVATCTASNIVAGGSSGGYENKAEMFKAKG